MGKQPDVNPTAGAKPAKGMKNEDGRINGSAYNKQNKASFNPKLTFCPNEDLKELPGRPGLEEGAY